MANKLKSMKLNPFFNWKL